MKDSVEINALFGLTDRRQLIAHLGSFDWDFQRYGPVKLVFGGQEVSLRFVGSGNQDGLPFVVLEPEAGAMLPQFPATQGDEKLFLRRAEEVPADSPNGV